MTSRLRVLVLAGGLMHTNPSIESTDIVIAADSGYDHALARGITVDRLVGDLDSISAEGLRHAEASNAVVDRYPADKDSTDLDLALQAAITLGASRIDIFGGEGGRLGHLLGVALAASDPRWAEAEVTWHTADGILRSATPDMPVIFTSEPGELVTILPVGTASGVTATGLHWDLDQQTLERGSSLGVSNEATGTQVRVAVRNGAVLVVQEGLIQQ